MFFHKHCLITSDFAFVMLTIYILKVILGSETQRDLLLSSARSYDSNNIRARPDIFPKDIIRRKAAVPALETRRQDGEENLRLLSFLVVRSCKRMLPRPV